MTEVTTRRLETNAPETWEATRVSCIDNGVRNLESHEQSPEPLRSNEVPSGEPTTPRPPFGAVVLDVGTHPSSTVDQLLPQDEGDLLKKVYASYGADPPTMN